MLVRARQGAGEVPVTLRADLLPLSITRITPDQGGTCDDNHRWVTLDIHGASFKAGALVKLSRPGIWEAEPDRWQVLDATHIRAVFDLRDLPHGLYDVSVINPDGLRVTDAYRYLVERGIEADVTIGIGGPRNLEPGEQGTYSVSLQSLTNVDTPYVRFDIGATEMGYSPDVLKGLNLPYVLFGSNVGGSPAGMTADAAGNNQSYGPTPTDAPKEVPLGDAPKEVPFGDGTARPDVPWAKLDGALDTAGYNLAPGYATDVAAGGYVGMSFNLQTYPGLAEWLNHDFEGLRDKLYALHPDWKEQGLLDGGVADLDKIEPDLARRFLSDAPDDHILKTEALALPFRFNVVGAATPLTRDEFVAEQTGHAKTLRAAILADDSAPSSLAVLAADEAQWTAGWLGALEAAGLLRALDEAPPIRDNPQVVSLNATLASGILLAKGGENYRTQADLLGFFAKVQQWYGDSAQYAGDPNAATVATDYFEYRQDLQGNSVEVPVPIMGDAAAFDRNAAQDTHFINFNVFAGSRAEMEYLRHIGVLDQDFNPVGAQSLNLTQYLQQAAQQNAEAQAVISVRGPQAAPGALAADGSGYVPADTPLPYSVSFNNPTGHAVGQLRIVTELDADLDPRSLRLSDLKIGDINVHIPADRANFQGDFDFSGSKGFILRVSAGIDATTRIATWLLQAIDPDTGEVMRDTTRGLLAPSADPNQADAAKLKSGFVGYSVRAADGAESGAAISALARIFIDDAPPVESAQVASTLDAAAPLTSLAVTALGNNADGAPSFDVSWSPVDDASGIKSVTVYVAEDGGDFRIWQRQLAPTQTQAIFTGIAGKRYEFLAVATDNAGNREAASVANAVLPDDGSRQAVLDALGVNETVAQTAELPLAAPDRSYAANALFEQASHLLPGQVAPVGQGDLASVLAPFSLRGFADGYAQSDADIGALAMVELADHSILVSAGSQRNEVFRYGEDGGHGTAPLFTLDAPVLDMAVDSVGQLWVMTGSELLQVDADSGAIIRRMSGPGQDPLTHALAIQPTVDGVGGDIYVTSGNGIEIFRPNETDPAKAWKHFSNQRAGDLAFAPDGRLWAVRWSGSDVTAAEPNATTDIVSFPLIGQPGGRSAGRPELEYRLAGLIDSIAFGAAGSELDGLMLASSSLRQRPVIVGVGATPHQASVWMIELESRRVLQVADGGTRGEAIVATADGRILVAQTGHIDEIAPIHAPQVTAISIPDGALVPLPMNRIAVVFDQAMWQGAAGNDSADAGSVLNPDNFSLTALGDDAGRIINPQSISWNAATRTAYLDIAGLPAGQWQLDISPDLRSATQIRMGQGYFSTFTAVLDFSSQIRLDFANTRADRASGEVSYDVSLTNIGTDDLNGPLMLLLDPGRYFGDGILGATLGDGELWILDVSAGLQALGGKLAAGATLANQTVTIVPAALFATRAGMADLVKAKLGHGVYAVPQQNLPPALIVAGAAAADADTLNAAIPGEAWSGQIEAIDPDGTQFFWQLVQAPAGVTLTPPAAIVPDIDGYHAVATLDWTPTARAAADSEIVVRVQDSRGGVATKRYIVPVTGGNHAPAVDGLYDITLAEGEVLSLPIAAADADGDRLTVTVKNLPPGAVLDAGSGLLTWVPGFDQAGSYNDVTIIASDGKATVSQRFNITVEQGYAQPVLLPVAAQTLREGDRYALQLAGSMPGGLKQADGTTITLDYAAPWLPGGATLNSETGWFEWTPDYDQHGSYRMPVTLTATFTAPDGETIETRVTREIVFDVANANGAPVFDAAETWNVLEGQPLRISVFAFDPDNPGFEPRIRFTPTAPAIGPETTAPTVSYAVQGLPPGASFDAETMEIVWTPGYAQAGSYSVTVTATDDGDAQSEAPLGGGTGTPAVSQLTLPIIITNANRAPEIGDIGNAFVDKGAALDIPVSAVDVDGNPVQLSFYGLPRFATYAQNEAPLGGAQNPSTPGAASGTLRFTPGEGDRGDYTITVISQDDGDGNVNQVLTQARTFILTVTSTTEAPVITLPRQVAAVVGQPLSVTILVSDMDQDALGYSAIGLPIGATITPSAQYGYATLTWTPEASDIGSHDIEITVTDSGLPPQDAGHTNPDIPVPNISTQTLRIVVREANAAPELLGVQIDGIQIADTGDVATPLMVNATEGVPLALDIFGRDADIDLIAWSAAGLPRGMTLEIPDGASGNRAILHWTPDLFAAQEGNAGSPGTWRFTLTASDGLAQFARTFEINVANVNQTPRILPLPLQLVSEGDTLGFTVRSADADNDPVQLALIYDESTPAGVNFDGITGYFEWTPGQDVVDNAAADDTPYTFTFRASDGSAATTQTVQVRVFDVNRAPRLTVQNHAVVIGQTLTLPVIFGSGGAGLPQGDFLRGVVASDPDGSAQTDALAISFFNLPEGASYDAQTRLLSWTPGPGQVGDFIVTAQVGDGKNTTTQTFTLRAVADAAANQPKILVSATPSTPAQPGQSIVATIRADAWSGIAAIAVEVRGEGIASNDWQTAALDGAGRLKLVATQPGLIDIRVTATDRDGFSATQTQTLRVRDTSDSAAPALAWNGLMAGVSASGRPVEVAAPTAVQAQLTERQLMGWKLEIAPAGTDRWQTLAEQSAAAANADGSIALTTIDPALWANGVYQLRLTAWDLAGRTSEIEARIVIDNAQKNIEQQSATDAVFTLAGHDFALTRTLDGLSGEFGNWRIPVLDLHLTTDQVAHAANGFTLPWQEGARVWLSSPDGQALRFTLGTTAERLGSAANAPQIWRLVFTTSQGWTLAAHSTDSDNTPEALVRQGSYLYDQATGLPWVPTGYTLTAADGTRYALDASGKLSGIDFADGAQWIVSDAGIAAATGDSAERIDFIRDSQGRIARIAGNDTSIVYRYAPKEVPLGDDASNRLILARRLDTPESGTPYAYDEAGKLLTDTITANLGAAVGWSSANWSGGLQAKASTTLAFAVRESELASTVKVPGGQGAVIVAIETAGADDIEVTGASVVGTATINGKRTTLLRVTEAGIKLLRLTGTGAASVRIVLAGDMNQDGNIDGADSAAWEQAGADTSADINGDGQINTADRQVLYANYGLRANRAPVVTANLPAPKTHTDLAAAQALASIAEDLEGDSVFWRVLGATHGTAKLSGDGQTLIFMPEAGYSGEAVITLQADDGFASTAPIELAVNVSGAKLLALHLDPLPSLRPGASAFIHATADFEDEKNVAVSAGSYLTVTQADLSPMGALGQSPVEIDDSRDLVRATASGPALVIVTRIDADGRSIKAVLAVNAEALPPPVDPNADPEADYYAPDPVVVQPDVYPGTLTLVPEGTRQLKVHLFDPDTGEETDISAPSHSSDLTTLDAQGQLALTTVVTSGTRYYSSDESVASVDANGLISAHQSGRVTISVVHVVTPVLTDYLYVTDAQGNETATPIYTLGDASVIGQSDIALAVQQAQVTDDDASTPAPQSIVVSAADGAAVSAATGETVLIGAGALVSDTPVSISRIAIGDIEAIAGIPVPAAGVLQAVGAFTLDIRDASADYPLQLAIPVQAGSTAQPSDEVLFFRKGTVLTQDGTYQDTWWLVDNGFVGSDGVARTASPPYTGLDSSGEYLVCTTLPGVTGGALDLTIGAGDWLSFDGLADVSVTIGGGLLGVNVNAEIIGIIATMSATATAGSYHFGVPQFSDIVLPTIAVGDTYSLDLDDVLPPVIAPWGNVGLPKIADLGISEVGNLQFTVSNDSPGQFNGEIRLRALFSNGEYVDVKTVAGNYTGQIEIASSDLKTADGKPFAIGNVRWQLVRLIPSDMVTGSGNPSGSKPYEFVGNAARISPRSDMAAVLTRTGIDFVRQEKVVGHTNLLGILGESNDFGGTYLTGNKVQPIVFTDDLSRAYVAGKGVVYEIDMLSFKLIDTVPIDPSNPATGKNIVSLGTAGSLLFIGEGQSFGAGAGNNRLLAMDINPSSENYKKVVSLQGTGIESSPLGVSGMTIGPDGKTLVVAVPINPNSVMLGDPGKRGDVLVFDLQTFDFRTGKIDAPIKAQLPGDALSGKAPQTISATKDADRYLVADVADYSRGLSTLVITRNDNGKITGAKMAAIAMSQPSNAIQIDRLDIQRAQSAVLVEYEGVQYAIVSDDNYNFLDPYWKAMYEVPEFIYTPSGPPVAVGGSASAKKVAVGGKLGIVKDPFGTPEYLGATLPLDGYGIVNLSVSEDGKVLVGQLKGGYSADISDLQQKPSQSHAWSVEALIRAALAMPTGYRLSKHLTLGPDAEQLIPTPATAPVGTAFDPTPVNVSIEGRMGDVVEVDLQRLAADFLAREALGFGTVPESVMSAEQLDKLYAKRSEIRTQMTLAGANNSFSLDYLFPKNGNFEIVPTNINDRANAYKNPYSRAQDGLTPAEFSNTGRMYLVPIISPQDEDTLRKGGRITTPKTTDLYFRFKFKNASGQWEWRIGTVTVTATDYDNPGVFFGDRPLEDPGYSAFTLKGEVKANSKGNDVLDVYRVEQRLRYLGFPVLTQSTDNGNPRTPKEFTVDGKFGTEEQLALRGFYAATHYDENFAYEPTSSGLRQNGFNTATGTAFTVLTGSDNLDWLNAYNAPHWMNIYASLGISYAVGVVQNQFSSGQGSIEAYGTSWIRDLLVAWRQQSAALAAAGLNSGPQRINGLTDPTFLAKPSHGKNGHSTGLAIDLGLSQLIDKDTNQKVTAIGPNTANGNVIPLSSAPITPNDWSLANAISWSSQLPSAPFNNLPNNQQDALRNFLALYAVTRADGIEGNGIGWDDIRTVNAIARVALFGSGQDGTQNDGLISNVWIGGNRAAQNPYENMRTVLEHLGIHTNTQPAHNTHFHIDLRRPNRIDIPNNLLADNAALNEAQTGVSEELRIAAQALLNQVQPHLNFEDGEVNMFVMDLPNVPQQYAQVMLVQASKATQASDKTDRTIGVCSLVQNPVREVAFNAVGPIGAAQFYFENIEHREVRAAGVITVLSNPRHGTLGPSPYGPGGYLYLPKPDYFGPDRATFLVEMGGKKIRMEYFFKVLHGVADDYTKAQYKQLCPNGAQWKISLSRDDPIDPQYTFAVPSQLTNTIAEALKVTLDIANLSGGALGQTTGTTITLDTNAAGHDWFIDPTPADNSEFLPTSNPNEWVAKSGSGAAGKMDMLSVLLHEYGHALGIEHSADSRDFMATTLQPGVRRLPSIEELALMAQLVGEIKSGSNGAPDTPQSPSLPIGTTLSALLVGRLRRTAYGSWSPVFDSVQVPAPAVRFEIAANPTLTDPKLQTGTGWETQGSVSIGNGAAILSETPASQTRLNQVFIIGEHDRYLSFTVAGIGLDAPKEVPLGDDQMSGPDDAFEAALLDANRGASLAGAIGLTRSDALMNLQADGTEFVGQGVTSTANADGSRTYRIDLSGIPAGTAVNLSFDLIGFGPATSSVTVRDIRIGIPEAHDDSVATLEDTPLAIAALANDLDADQPGFVPAVVAGPAHGTVTLNPDGSFSYLPEADYYGADSFTYKLSDGAVDSNIATVSISIAPVNDAPVVQALSDTTAEDTPVTIDLLVQASDVEGSPLTPAIVAGPQHGQLSVAADGSFTYTPDADYNGTDSFTYQVNDGELDSNIASVSLSITPVNDAPLANPIAATLAEDGSITLDLIAGAFDVDGDALTLSATDPQAGTLTHNPDGTWTYAPAPDFNGEDGFTYSVSDGQLAAGSFVRLTITAVNDAPVAADDSAALIEDGSIRLALLANDHDVDGDALSVLIEGQPTHGAVVLNADNTVTYTPAKDWSGEDSFSYRLSDGQALSEIATVRLAVNSIADAPILVLTDRGGNSRELFRTGWESVRNKNTNSTLVEARELEGWRLVTVPSRTRGGHHDGKDDHDRHDGQDDHEGKHEHGSFEIWSDGDRMRNAQGRQQIVHAAKDDGSNWLELGDAMGEGHQSLGIERRIDTVAGASYTLSLDYAGRIGYGAEYTAIGIYVDGEKIASYAATSPATALDWKALLFQFTGTGGRQTIRIVSEATQIERNGRGAMLDDIALTETLPANTGFEDGAIGLSAISAALTDTDGSETLTVAIQALPVGATLSDGSSSFTATQGSTTADVTGWNLGSLSLVPPTDFYGSIELQVVASTTESANGNQAGTTANLTVTVLAVNDAPVAKDANFTVEKGGSIRIDFAQLISDVDAPQVVPSGGGNALTLTLAKPKHGTLTRNADGTYTYTPKRGYSGSDGFGYSVSDGSLSASGWIAINVLRDDDDCHNDHGHHNGFDRGGHKAYAGHGHGHDHDHDHDRDRGASIVVRSTDRNAAPFSIDWNGSAGSDFMRLPVTQPDWLAQSLGIPQPDKRSLAEITGLVVRMKG